MIRSLTDGIKLAAVAGRSMVKGKMEKSELIRVMYAGQWNALDALLKGWTDDNELNRSLVESLLAQAMFKMAGID